MSSLSDTATTAEPRARVLRGSAAAAVATAPMERVLVPGRTPGMIESMLAAEARAEAQEAGYRDGYQAGLTAATADVRRLEQAREERAGRAVAAVVEAARALHARQVASAAAIEDELVAAAFDLARAVLDRELAVAAAPGRDAVARALRLAGDPTPATVRLHPDDVATLGDLTDLAPGWELTVVADAAVGPGGCLVEAGASRIDARLETALERAIQALGA